MTAPVVLNWHHLDETPEDAVFIGRPSKWGNPFRIHNHGSRAKVIEKYRAYLLANPALLAAARDELRGRVLVCYCKPLPCWPLHATNSGGVCWYAIASPCPAMGMYYWR